MSDTTLLTSLGSRFLLREAESRARRIGDVERRDFAVQLQLARQKLDSAQVLWAHQQYVEGLRLAEESVTESLRSAELCSYVLPTPPVQEGEAGADPLWVLVLRELGARPEHIQDARLCQNGIPGGRPALNGQISVRERGYFQKAIQVSYQVVERLRPVARTPRDIVFSRWGRVAMLAAGFAVTVGLALGTLKLVRSDKQQEVSLRERSARDGFLFREDGSKAVFVVQGETKYFIPSNEEFGALKYSYGNVEVVAPGSLGHLRDKPADGALLKERGNPTVFRFEGGKKRPFASQSAFDKRGFKSQDVKTVPTGSLVNVPVGPPLD
jgi:hypothetical protein